MGTLGERSVFAGTALSESVDSDPRFIVKKSFSSFVLVVCVGC